jgi:hypothetical protein
VKQKVLLGLFVCLFSAQVAFAQIGIGRPCTQPLGTTATGVSPQVGCPVQPPPTPTPTPTPVVSGFLRPKYHVVTVTYAPPGVQSNVTYSDSTMLGTTTSISSSFTNDTNVSASITTGFDVFGIGVSTTITTSGGLTEESDDSSSTTINESATQTTVVRGPSSSAVGIDHDEDVIWVWLNPVLPLTFTSPTSLVWGGFGYDINDPVGGIDMVGIPVRYLNGHSPMPVELGAVLARTWAQRVLCDPATQANCAADGTTDPGLNAADLASILASDPFANPAYLVTAPIGSQCTVDHRFCRLVNQGFEYSPADPGGQARTHTFTLTKLASQTDGTGSSDTEKLGFSVTAAAGKDSFGFSNFLSELQAKLTISDTLTWQHKSSAATTNQTTKTASFTVTGPTGADNYTGPIEFDVYQDNLYGTFMFSFINQPLFTISASSTLPSANPGSCANFTVTVAPLVIGFTGDVALGASSLPAGATATFTPAVITGGIGSSILTVCTTTAAPPGTYTLNITGTRGQEIHVAPVSFTVNTPPDFSISATPAGQTAFQGTSSSFNITTSVVSGFNGVETLSMGGLPVGATARFLSPSITGAGSAAFVITTSTATPVGSYTITITGTSGALIHSTVVGLAVKASTPPPCPHVPCTVTN